MMEVLGQLVSVATDGESNKLSSKLNLAKKVPVGRVCKHAGRGQRRDR